MLLRLSLLASLLFFAPSCAEEIGDSCNVSSDCSSDGTRICDTSSSGGYCTIIGCDVGTCPDEAVCVRFFPVTSSNQFCDPATEDQSTNTCTADEVCTFSGTCAPRNSEVRFCMNTCGSNGDCRDNYECRNEELMKEHGGEPVPEAGEATGSKLTRFCASEG